MKSFVEYLIESAKTYEFRIKLAGELTDDHITKIESQFEKFGLESISKPKKTPIQENPMGFGPKVKNSEVHIFDVELNYPTTPQVLTSMLEAICEFPESHIIVVNKNDPEEIAREVAKDTKEEEYKTALGNDYDQEKLDPTYGDEYNKNFLKELETRKYEFASKEKK